MMLFILLKYTLCEIEQKVMPDCDIRTRVDDTLCYCSYKRSPGICLKLDNI